VARLVPKEKIYKKLCQYRELGVVHGEIFFQRLCLFRLFFKSGKKLPPGILAHQHSGKLLLDRAV